MSGETKSRRALKRGRIIGLESKSGDRRSEMLHLRFNVIESGAMTALMAQLNLPKSGFSNVMIRSSFPTVQQVEYFR